MKYLVPILLLSLCGCRTPTPVATLPVPLAPAPVRPPPIPAVVASQPARPASAPPDAKSRQQTQLIEALINQNEALTARIAAMQAAPAKADVPTPSSPAVPVAVPVPVAMPAESAIAPNADGVIDLAAFSQSVSANEPVNPFAVRSVAGEKSREVSLLVGGIILGKAPCAMVNGRLVQPGETFEGFEVEAIQSGAVIVRNGAHRLRLPVSTTPTRVKLAL